MVPRSSLYTAFALSSVDACVLSVNARVSTGVAEYMKEAALESSGSCRTGRRVRILTMGPAIGLLLVSALALAIRLHRIGQQSVWIDDFGYAGALGVKGFSAQLAFFRIFAFDSVPLDFLLQQFWAALVGVSPWKLRLLPVLFSVLCVPMIYLLGEAVWGRRVGLLAALFFAVSPFHAWFGQALRPYALLGLLVLVAMYSGLRITTNGGRKWWVINLAASLALLWTHLFAVFFLTAEGLFLLWAVRPRRMVLFVWAPLVAVSALSVLLWMLPSLRNVPPGDEDADFTMPTAAQIAVGFLGNDAALVSTEFPPSTSNLPFLTLAQRAWLTEAHPIPDTALCAVFAVALALAVPSLLSRRAKGAGASACCADPARQEVARRTGSIDRKSVV